jgi:glutamate decarboxylase
MSGERFHLDAATAVAQCDEDTIGVVSVLSSTFDGSCEPVEEISAALDELAGHGGPDVPVHVDGASRAMIAPLPRPGAAVGLPAVQGSLDQHCGS